MKLVYKQIDGEGSGYVSLIPEVPDDMWHVYNLVSVEDTVRSGTTRNLLNPKATTETDKGSTASSKVCTTLSVSVEKIDFDAQASMLCVKGKINAESPYVKMGVYHTLQLELQKKFSLGKKEWDSIALERIELATNPAQTQADVAAVMMQEGLANIFLITGCMTLDRAKIEVSIPRKRKGMCSEHDKGLEKFYDQVIQALIRHINFGLVKCCLIASPGFVKEHFYEYMFAQASKLDQKELLQNKSKFLLIHSSSGFKHSLIEVLGDPAVQLQLADTKAASELQALNDFQQILQSDIDSKTELHKVFYGIGHVEYANDSRAIKTLLVPDILFRSSNSDERRRYVRLVDSVRDSGGDVKIFSSAHATGENLAGYGVAAILRFELADPDDVGV